jgi:hypothetical protein
MPKDEAPKPKRLVAVQFLKDLKIFGRPLSSVSEAMQGLHIHWDGTKLVITAEGDSGSEEWVHPQAIAAMRWR